MPSAVISKGVSSQPDSMNPASVVIAFLRNAERNASSVMSRPIRNSTLRWATSYRLSEQTSGKRTANEGTAAAALRKVSNVSQLGGGGHVRDGLRREPALHRDRQRCRSRNTARSGIDKPLL